MSKFTERRSIYTLEADDYLLVGKTFGETTPLSPLGVIDIALTRSSDGLAKEFLRDIYRTLGKTIGHTPYLRSGYLGFTAIYHRNAPLIDRVVHVASTYGDADIRLLIKCFGSCKDTLSLVTGSKPPYSWPHDIDSSAPQLNQSAYDDFISAVRQLPHVEQKKEEILLNHREDLKRHKSPSHAQIHKIRESLSSLGLPTPQIISFLDQALPLGFEAVQPPPGEKK